VTVRDRLTAFRSRANLLRTKTGHYRPVGPAPGAPAALNVASLLPLGCTPTVTTPHRTRQPTAATRVTDLSGQNIWPGYPIGVALLLLSPSASPERVWLYAAKLDERCSCRTFRYLPVAFETAGTLRSSPFARDSGGPPTPRSPNPYASVVDHLTGNRANTNGADDVGIPAGAQKEKAPISCGNAKPAAGQAK